MIDAYKVDDNEKIIGFIRSNSFADLITFHDGSLSSNKVPFFFDSDKNMLYGHFARANPQLIDIEKSGEVLAVFSGPQAYISPQWYESEGLVPTWNFQTLQVHGNARIVDNQSLFEILTNLSQFHESKLTTQWSMDELSPEKLAFMLKMIVGFEIEITDIKFKEKMSQNKSVDDQHSVIASLNKIDSKAAKDVAAIMSNNLPEN